LWWLPEIPASMSAREANPSSSSMKHGLLVVLIDSMKKSNVFVCLSFLWVFSKVLNFELFFTERERERERCGNGSVEGIEVIKRVGDEPQREKAIQRQASKTPCW